MDRAVLSHDGPWTEEAYLELRHDGRAEVVDGTLVVGPGAGKQRLEVIERVRAAITAALPNGLRVIGPVPLRLGPDCVLMPDLVVTSALTEDVTAKDVTAGDVTAGDAGENDAAEKADGAAADGADGAAADSAEGSADKSADDSADDSATAAAGDPAAQTAKDAGDEPDATATADASDPARAVLVADDALMVVEVIGFEHGAADRTFKPQLYARSRIPYSVLIDHDAPFAVAEMIIGGRYHEYAYAGEGAALRIEEPFELELDLTEITVQEPEPDPAS